jgi:S-(hydroxymethyl)mycothiol dehydrogenase
MTIEARGAVVEERGAPVRIEPILVDPPEAGEVLVRIDANGLCHSDHWAVQHGNWGAPFPMLLGHEGAGVIEATGSGVEHVRSGDRVILSWAVPCGVCRPCRRGAPRRCAHAWMQPSRIRVARTGETLQGTLSLGTLATHTVVHAAQAIPVADDVDLSRVCLLGCGASTGLGGAINTGGTETGDVVAVIGLGGIGLAALQGARLAGATTVIAIDVMPWKLEVAATLGATDTFDASAGDPVAAVLDLTHGEGVDVAIEATGNTVVVAQAVAMLARAGRAVAIGVPRPGDSLTLPWGDDQVGAAYPNKATLLVTDGGDPIPAEDFPVWVDAYRRGALDLDAMVTREVPFTDAAIDEAFRAMLAGEVIRTVIHVADDLGHITA